MKPLKNVFQDFDNRLLEKIYFRRYFRENQQKVFVTFSELWPLSRWGWGERVNPLKRKIWDENFFQRMLIE